MNVLFFLTPKNKISYISDKATVRQAIEKMEHHGYTAMPILDENGKVDAKKIDPIIYDGVTHAYWNFGEKVGQAFSDGKKIK